MTYLELVNDVLVRLRETEVASVNDTAYSKLIGKFVNDAKRRVEDAFNWNALSTTITITTSANTYSYILTGSQGRFKLIDVFNDTNNYPLQQAPVSWLNTQFLIATPSTGDPYYYGFNGVDTNGDTKVDIFPIPNGVSSIRFNLVIPQASLSSDSTVLTIPYEPVVQGAYALALAERGDDGGLSNSDAANIYRTTLADTIAIESSRYCENDVWSAV